MNSLKDLDPVSRKILETIKELSIIPGISSPRGVPLKEVTEKLRLSERDYMDRLEDLNERGFLRVSSTGWVATLTSKGRRVLQERSESNPVGKKPWYKNPVLMVPAVAVLLAAIITIIPAIIHSHPQQPSLLTNSSPATNITQKGQNIESPIIIGPINGNITFNPVNNMFNNNTTTAKSNLPPKLYGLSPDKSSHQIEGTTVTWTVDALDEDHDPLVYKFFLNGPNTGDTWVKKTGWVSAKTWTWTSSAEDVGNNLVMVWVRDGKNAGMDSKDDSLVSDAFTIDEPKQKPAAQPLTPVIKPVTVPANMTPAEDKPPVMSSLTTCPKPYIDSISPSDPEVGQDVIFKGGAKLCTDSARIRTYELTSDIDNDLYSGKMPTFRFKFRSPGVHKLTFTAIDENNRRAWENKNIEVFPTK